MSESVSQDNYFRLLDLEFNSLLAVSGHLWGKASQAHIRVSERFHNLPWFLKILERSSLEFAHQQMVQTEILFCKIGRIAFAEDEYYRVGMDDRKFEAASMIAEMYDNNPLALRDALDEAG